MNERIDVGLKIILGKNYKREQIFICAEFE